MVRKKQVGDREARRAPILQLPGDILARVLAFVGEPSFSCVRATCRALQGLASLPARPQPRSAMLHTPALVAWAWSLPGFRSAAFDEREQRQICKLAARVGNVAVLAWLREQGGCAWDSDTCAEAAAAGHLEVLQWARAHGCDWDGRVSEHAAGRGHLDVLRWARANGCTWSNGTCTSAAAFGHLETLQWAVANGCPFERADCLSLAEFRCNTELASWLRTA